jgi:photosystem II stability/assembly factor-like uncharacterized protein
VLCLAATLLTNLGEAQSWGRPQGPAAGNTQAFASAGGAIYAYLMGSGVYKSTDNGASWGITSLGAIPISQFEFPLLATSENAVYAADYYGPLYESFDGGEHWRSVAVSAGYGIQALAATENAIFVSSSGEVCVMACPDTNGVYRSTDQGQTWSRQVNGLTLGGESISILLTLGGSLLAGSYDGLFRSDDYAESWRQVAFAGHHVSRLFFTDALYALTDVDQSVATSQFFRSTDLGATWTSIPTVPSRGAINAFAGGGALFEVTDFSGCTLYSCEIFFASRDGGQTWSPSHFSQTPFGEVLENPNAFFLAGQRVLLGTSYQGMFASGDGGATWLPSNRGLFGTFFVPLVVGSTIYGGNGINFFASPDGGASWDPLATPEGLLQTLIISRGSLFLGSLGQGVLRSDDGGLSWNPVNSGLGNPDVCALLDVNGTLFAGKVAVGAPLYRSRDRQTWQPTALQPYDNVACSLAAVNGVVFAGDGAAGIWRSTDAGETWSKVYQIDGDGLFSRRMFGVGSTLFVETVGGVIRTDDLGEAWRAGAPGGLRVNAVTAADGDHVFGIGDGVFLGSLQSDGWTSMNLGLVNRDVTSLQVSGGELYAFPRGTGVQKLPLSALPQRVISPLEPAPSVPVSGRP